MNTGASLQQKRANHAWNAVQRGKKEASAKFPGQAKKLAPRILTAGLGPALAFLAAKDKDSIVLKCLGSWLTDRSKTEVSADTLQQHIMTSSDELRRCTAEALEWLVWVNRFCEADEDMKDEAE